MELKVNMHSEVVERVIIAPTGVGDTVLLTVIVSPSGPSSAQNNEDPKLDSLTWILYVKSWKV